MPSLGNVALIWCAATLPALSPSAAHLAMLQRGVRLAGGRPPSADTLRPSSAVNLQPRCFVGRRAAGPTVGAAPKYDLLLLLGTEP